MFYQTIIKKISHIDIYKNKETTPSVVVNQPYELMYIGTISLSLMLLFLLGRKKIISKRNLMMTDWKRWRDKTSRLIILKGQPVTSLVVEETRKIYSFWRKMLKFSHLVVGWYDYKTIYFYCLKFWGR